MDAESLLRLYQETLPPLLSCVPSQDGLYTLLRELQRAIPFKLARFHFVDRQRRTMETYLEYTSHQHLQNPYVTPMLDEQAPDAELEELYAPVGHSSLIRDARQNAVLWAHMRKLGINQRSLIISMLDAENGLERRYSLTLVAPEPGTFTEAHAALLEAMLVFIRPLFRQFLQNRPEGTLFLSPGGVLPVTAENQLRRCPGLRATMELVDIIASTDITVLITGPTGSGKELVAETLHTHSHRYEGPLIRVNCGSIPENLLESAFFGHEKGSFTGAQTRQIGYFENANRGTIYLDEIGELPLSAQVRLLRVLENREIMRVGSSHATSVDVRVVAATHRDLPAMVEQGLFREDLYYRLAVFPVTVPPLSERSEDIPILADYFYRRAAERLSPKPAPRLTSLGLAQLQSRPWPGNVRQLRHAMERAMLLAVARRQGEVTFEPEAGERIIQSAAPDSTLAPGAGSPRPEVPDKARILQALDSANWRIQGPGGAAAMLGCPPATLRKRMRKHGIPLPRERVMEEGV